MFSEIEAEYKRGLQQKRFVAYYWPGAALVMVLAIIFTLVFRAEQWLVYGCAVIIFFTLAIIFFTLEYRYAKRKFRSVRDSKGLSAKIAAYFMADDEQRINNLVMDLARHDIRTKENLKLTLDYFQAQLPGNDRPNLLGWALTAVITLSSVVIVAYDDTIRTINLRRLIPVFGSALVVALIILTPFIIVKIISASVLTSHNKIDTILVEDLAYIYVHFEEFQKKLENAK